MGLFGKKENEVEKLFIEHFDMVGKTIGELKLALSAYLEDNLEFKDYSFNVHKLEHKADIIRHSVELKLYKGAFLPIYRQDYLTLIEQIDKIANRCEDVADFLSLTRPEIPVWMKSAILQLMGLTDQTFLVLRDGFKTFLQDMDNVFGISEKVGDKEQAVDKLEWDITRKIFKSDLELAHKLLLREFVVLIGKLSNRMEDVADHFEVMSVKRRF